MKYMPSAASPVVQQNGWKLGKVSCQMPLCRVLANNGFTLFNYPITFAEWFWYKCVSQIHSFIILEFDQIKRNIWAVNIRCMLVEMSFSSESSEKCRAIVNGMRHCHWPNAIADFSYRRRKQQSISTWFVFFKNFNKKKTPFPCKDNWFTTNSYLQYYREKKKVILVVAYLGKTKHWTLVFRYKFVHARHWRSGALPHSISIIFMFVTYLKCFQHWNTV